MTIENTETTTTETTETAPVVEETTAETTAEVDDTPAENGDAVVVKTQKKRTSKSWYVKVKNAAGAEREERITGVLSAEAALAAFTPEDGDVVLGARPVRAFK